MQYTITHQGERRVTSWTGGTTEQLFIWPDAAEYALGNFFLRVSTAAVQLPQSDFTLLPGLTRWIMPLSGSMKLEHEGQGSVTLAPGQAHRFDGGWVTHATGQCVDFNLMLADGWEGAIACGEGEYPCHREGFAGVYAYDGGADVILSPPEGERETIRLGSGDLLVVRGAEGLTLTTKQPMATVFTAQPVQPLWEQRQ